MKPEILSFGVIGGRPLFMDVADDLYFMVPPEDEQVATSRAVCITASPPSRSIFDKELDLRAHLADILGVFRVVLRVRRERKRRRFARLLNQVLGTYGRTPNGDEGLDVLAARFALARTALPIQPDCLTDSLALISWVGPSAAACDLVFGAKLDPFAAHCWVQAGNLLLSDRLEAIERFTPVGFLRCAAATH